MAYDSFAYWGFRGKYRLLIIFNNNKDIYSKHEMFMLLYKYKTVAKIARISFIGTLFSAIVHSPQTVLGGVLG